jgi:hydrogenase maturation protein HypF
MSDPKTIVGREDEWALAVHHAIADAAFRMVSFGLSRSPSRTVGLSGGVFMNRVLNDRLVPALRRAGLNVALHRLTPPNDGCLSFGQAIIAGLAERM